MIILGLESFLLLPELGRIDTVPQYRAQQEQDTSILEVVERVEDSALEDHMIFSLDQIFPNHTPRHIGYNVLIYTFCKSFFNRN